LRKGTFELDSTTLNAKANGTQPTFYKAIFLAQLSATGPVTLFDGTGLYKGITGMPNIIETYAFISPLSTTGQNKERCNLSARPISQYSSITGSGTVSRPSSRW
jgi:hypothetical protein